MAHAEASLATDDTLNVLYAYVMLFMLKIGVTRATLGGLAERLSFRDFESTLALYVARIVDATGRDSDLVQGCSAPTSSPSSPRSSRAIARGSFVACSVSRRWSVTTIS